jgi:molybdopterin synthase sulfur carrier subunit
MLASGDRMRVNFYATLRPLAGGKTVELDLGGGTTAGDLLHAVSERFPAIGELLWTDAGELGDYIKVFIDGREIRHLQRLETPVPAGAEVDIFPPAAGG